MIRVTVELISSVDESRNTLLGTMVICNDGTGSMDISDYDVTLHAEYTPPEGRKCRVFGFKRRKRSVWSLIGDALKSMGHVSKEKK